MLFLNKSNRKEQDLVFESSLRDDLGKDGRRSSSRIHHMDVNQKTAGIHTLFGSECVVRTGKRKEKGKKKSRVMSRDVQRFVCPLGYGVVDSSSRKVCGIVGLFVSDCDAPGLPG